MVSTSQEMGFYYDLGFNVIAVGTEMKLLMEKISNLIKIKVKLMQFSLGISSDLLTNEGNPCFGEQPLQVLYKKKTNSC